MSRYLVTGTAGFIGAAVTEQLLRMGKAVVGIDNLNDAYDPRMKQYRISRLQNYPAFTFHKLDICDRSLLSNPKLIGRKYDAVINLAARAGVRDSIRDPWQYLNSNAVGTLNMLEFSIQENINKFVLASSSSVYGPDVPHPTPETADSSAPIQVYAASKIAAESLAHAYHYLHGLDISVLRYFTVYGPAGRPDMMMFRLAKWIAEGAPVHLFGSGEQSRGFTYIEDIVQGTIAALIPLGYEIINLGGHELISMNELISRFEVTIGSKANIVFHPQNPADLKINLADISKAKKLLDWEPQFSLADGIKEVVAWYREERSWANDIVTD